MNDWEKRFQDIIDEVHQKSEQEKAAQQMNNTSNEEAQKVNTEYQGGNYTYSYGGQYQTEPPKSTNETHSETKKVKYVTKKALVVALAICMVCSAAIGAGCYALAMSTFGGTTVDKSVNTTNYNLVKATGAELSIQEIVARNENAVVAITTEAVVTSSFWFGSSYVTQGAGSGVIYSKDGYIITNNHVIKGAKSIKVTLHDGTQYDATVVGTDDLTDVAVIKIEATGLTTIVFGDINTVAVGDLAVAIGNPLGTLAGTPTEGIISALEREITLDDKKMKLIQTSASINPGNSGGGLFDQYGKMIGLVVAKSGGTNVEGLGFAIPCDRVADVSKSLIEKGYVAGRPQAGIKIIDLTSAYDAMQYGVPMTGVYISDVIGTNAKRAGLQPGDMIYMLDQEQVLSSSQLIAMIQNHQIGDKVTFTIVRNNKMENIEIELEEAQNVQ